MTISEDKGRKSDDDVIIKYNDLPISILEVGKLLLKLWENEDRLYRPPQFKGAQMSKDFIDELFEKREITDEMLRKYKLGKYKHE